MTAATAANPERVQFAAEIDRSADAVWAAVRDVYEVHERLVPGMVREVTRDGDDRIVTFANGAVAREQILAIDDTERRLTYGVVGEGIAFHRASMQVQPRGEGSTLIWSAEYLPKEIGGFISGVMTPGIQLMKQTLERS